MNVVNNASKSGNLVKENEGPPPGGFCATPGGVKGIFGVSDPSCVSGGFGGLLRALVLEEWVYMRLRGMWRSGCT